MKIAFSNMCSDRLNSSITLYNLAHYNETLLGNESIVILAKDSSADPDIIGRMKNRFTVFECEQDVHQTDAIILTQSIDALFLIKDTADEFFSNIVPNLVYMGCLDKPKHTNSIFAFTNNWLSEVCETRYNQTIPYLPVMIDFNHIEGNNKQDLGIPDDAFIFGYVGDEDSFDIPWINESIKNSLNNRDNLYCLLMNVKKEYTTLEEHPRLRFLPGTSNQDDIVKFIKTCDAMINCSQQGEKFDINYGRFSNLNKPIVGFTDVDAKGPINVLGNKFIGYKDGGQLQNILTTLNHKMINSTQWDLYKEHTPELVINRFKEIFLDPLQK